MPYYGYGYYSYTDFLANHLYFLLLIPVLLLSLWAQLQVSGSFRKYSQAATRRRFTGAMAAEAVLRFNGVYDVPIRPCRGILTDPTIPGTTPSTCPRGSMTPPPSRRWGWRPTRRATPSSTRRTMPPSGCAPPSSP